ncbi:MAG TPA: hypothetical protein VMM56_03630 [Planctomycetaceae bacterium]|nr:hypothetical protein [Planctomycetaceae bacterium]
MTSIAYIEPRLTQDVDLVIDREVAAQKIDSLMTALSQSDFFIEEQSVRSAIAEKRMFQLIDLVELLKVDIYPRELIAGELDRSVRYELFDGVVKFPSLRASTRSSPKSSESAKGATKAGGM